MGLLSCLFIKKSFENESPFLRSNGVTNRKRNNFTGKTEMLLIKKKINGKNVVIFSLSLLLSLRLNNRWKLK